MNPELPRRDLLKWAAAAGTSALVGENLFAQPMPTRTRPLRLIHMTDHHLMDFMNARGSQKGIEAAYAHAMAFRPDVIANGGDFLTHGIERPLADLQADAKTILNILPKSGVRIINACGNHDIWGWNKRKSGATGNEPLYGKNFYMEYFGEGFRYRAVDLGTWTMLVLDSTQPWNDGYQGGLDDEQFEWMQGELNSSDRSKPVIVLSHIPILNSGIILQDARTGPDDDHDRGVTLPKGSCHQDLWRMVDAFYRHGNVKIALSGHVHVDERTDILGTSHISSGAVCGSWWTPREQIAVRATLRERQSGSGILRTPRADPGFGIFNLYPDGSFEYKYELIPWEFIQG